MKELLETYPVVIEIPVAWGEMDSLRHVNNIVYFRYFESARMAYFQKLDIWTYMNETGIGPILASTQCKFKFPLTYPDTVSVGTKISGLEADRFVMKYVAVSHEHERVAAEGEGLIVSYDYRALKKVPLPEEIRERIEILENSTPRSNSSDE
ncbi:MAG TPA: thioesterase family protein [Pyrinomonadaceae bacterium]|jgi:acyl-CoA thioester hydrolase|nr:thioesterase family protein [Pyrinomonadaceae bacterium]